MLSPKRTKYRKQHRGRLKGKSSRGNMISFGKFALQALGPAWVTARQIEAGRRAITRNARRGGKLWIRVFPDKPITMRPAETRMGSGKGSPEYWVSVIRPGRIIHELSGVSEDVAKIAMTMAARKLPIPTRVITSLIS
uniref:Large ribosomal subunit protein uL16c n=1 Tax=Odontosoria chinensis TaxID=32133 RepID=A0A343WSG6_9MONI|nr:ribosomal protein L16 [Odontosoria chinensis]